MSVELNVEPGKVYNWSEFKREKPFYSIALDGFVDSSTKRNANGPYANYNHHSGVDRLSTRSTSEQVYLEIKMGLFDTFQEEGIPNAQVYVNDSDEDVCLSWWLLKNHEQVKDRTKHNIHQLVNYEDLLDTTGGAYPLEDINMRRQMAWIFEPYNEARFHGRLAKMDEGEMKEIIESVEERIDDYVLGKGKELSLEGHYEKIGGGKDWALTKETGTASRRAMYEDGINAFATLVEEREDDYYVYVLGKKSAWVPFDIKKLYKRLNEEEGFTDEHNKWGGSNVIGGSPKETGSKLPPEKLEEIINLSVE